MFFSRTGTFEVYKHLSVILNASYEEDFERNTFIYKEQILRPAYEVITMSLQLRLHCSTLLVKQFFYSWLYVMTVGANIPNMVMHTAPSPTCR